MIRWFYKYGFLLMLFNTILYSINQTKDTVAPFLFYLIMGLGLLFVLVNPSQIRGVLFHKSFSFLMALNFINLVYYLFFDSISNFQSLEYLMARFMSFSLISLSIYHNFQYYKNNFFPLLIKIIFIVVIVGLFIDPFILSARYYGIIWNPNMLASLTILAFSFLFLKNEKKSNFEIFMMLLLIIVTLSTGSRSVLIAVVLSFVMKYGFTIRNILYSIMLIISIILISNTNLDTSFNRISSQGIFNDRTEQFYFAVDNLKQKLFVGYGLDEYSGLPKDIEIPEELENLIIGAHNGYLSILIQYGILFGGLVVLIMFRKSLQIIQFFKNISGIYNIYLFVIIYTLIAANFESLFTGINEFHTLLFWLSLSFLSHAKFLSNHEI